MTVRAIDRIVIHCSATREGQAHTAADIDRWHKAQGWSKIGYHYVIRLDGTVEPGRPESEIGSHAKGFNANSIGIVYIGGVAANGQTPKDTRTDAQRKAMADLLKRLMTKYPGAKVMGHRDLSPDKNKDGKITPNEWMKACPSFDVAGWMNGGMA